RDDRGGRVHAAVRRVRGGASAFPRWAGAAAEPPVGAAPAGIRSRRRTGAGDRRGARRPGAGVRVLLAGGPRRGFRSSDVLHRSGSRVARGTQAARHAREAFAVLLFQDVSVIPLIALLPLLSDSGTHAAGGWIAAAKGLAVIAVVIIS